MYEITDIIMTIQHVNMSGLGLYYIMDIFLDLEAIWMHTCVTMVFDLKPPLRGPIISLTIQNGPKC